MGLVAGLDVGGSAVKAWVAERGGAVLAAVNEGLATQHPSLHTAEFTPAVWWEACHRALAAAVTRADRPAEDYDGLTVSSLRQGFVLLGKRGELGKGVLGGDQRGARMLGALRRRHGSAAIYAHTGHWLAPELTLPKLMTVASAEVSRWQRTERIMFVHDWLLWRLSGALITEVSHASSGQMTDVRARTWASDLLTDTGVGTGKLCRLVEAGTVVGGLRTGLVPGLSDGLPVVAGGGDTHLAAVGAGGLEPGVATVVAGSSTPVQLAVDAVPADPLRHPWVSAHVAPGRWAAETNAGYAGTALGWFARLFGLASANALAVQAWRAKPGARGVTAVVAAPEWSEDAWATRAPNGLLGFTPAHDLVDVARALVEAHAYGIRANLDDLERASDARLRSVRLVGGAARSSAFAQLVADVCGRVVEVPVARDVAALGGAALVDRALGGSGQPADGACDAFNPRVDSGMEDGYERFRAAHRALLTDLPQGGAVPQSPSLNG
jgi:sugar (pentulose or hexulose) kinase